MKIVANIAYEQGSRIDKGQGKNSIGVFLCKDDQLGGELAVKIIAKTSLPDPSAFWLESKAMHEARHDHVVPIQYACQDNDNIMLAMPYYRKGSLADRIADGPLRPLEVIRVGQGILSGLYHVHVAGHLHFDLKPSNVLFSDYDTPMVADFGQSQVIGPNGLAPSPDLIYAAGVPPEVFLSQQGVIASDVYQAGVTLYRAANGDQCFNNQFSACGAELRDMTLNGTFPDRDAYLPHVSRAMRGIINKAIQVDVSKRYATALEFANALGRVRPKYNWQTICLGGNKVEWRSQRAGSPELVVRLLLDGPKWRVMIHNERPVKAIATKKVLWKKGMTYRQSHSYLKQVFAALE